MKIQIRSNVFETNSSSVHSLTLTNSRDYEEFLNGNRFYWEGVGVMDAADVYENYKKHSYADENITLDDITGVLKLSDEEEAAIHNVCSYAELKEELGESCKVSESVFNAYIELDSIMVLTFHGYQNLCEEMEEFEEQYTTPHGDTVVAFGYTGWC